MVYAGAGILICVKCRLNEQKKVETLLSRMVRTHSEEVTQNRFGILAYTPINDIPQTMLEWLSEQRRLNDEATTKVSRPLGVKKGSRS